MADSSPSITRGKQNRRRSRLALPDGFRMGRYLIGDQLGAGGFGITYRAKDLQLNRLVAIKELLPTSIATRSNGIEVVAESEEDDWEWAQTRFIQEAETVAACEHPNVLQVYEVLRANGTVYMVTRFEEGANLEEWYCNLGRPPNEAEIRSILEPMLSALHRVHGRGFLHRDIKPDNIYMADDGRPVLIDFGSAREKITHKSLPLTKILTPGYAPFEQYLDEAHQGPYTDLYSLAAVLYRGIAGRKPPDAPERSMPSVPDTCVRLAKDFAHRYDKKLLESIDTALSPEGKHRPQSAAAWIKQIGAKLDLAEPPPLPPRTGPARPVPAPGPRTGGTSERIDRSPQLIRPRPHDPDPDAPPLAVVTLEPIGARNEKEALPVKLVAATHFRIGRERKSVDHIAWFWPRNTEHDARTMRLGRIHSELIWDGRRVLIQNMKSSNGTAFGGAAIPDDAAMVLGAPGMLQLGGDYQLEVSPFKSQVAGGESALVGAVRFTPANSAPAFVRSVWVISDATFGTHASNPIILHGPGMGEVNGRFLFQQGQFQLEAFAGKPVININGRAVAPGRPVAIGGNFRLQIGGTEFAVNASG